MLHKIVYLLINKFIAKFLLEGQILYSEVKEAAYLSE